MTKLSESEVNQIQIKDIAENKTSILRTKLKATTKLIYLLTNSREFKS